MDHPPRRMPRHIHYDDNKGMASIEHAPVIVHCHLRWDFVWQRPQHVFSRLAEHHPVIFIEEPLIEGAAPAVRVTEPCPNVWRVVPVLPAPHSSVDQQWDTLLPILRAEIDRSAIRIEALRNGVQWFYSPMPAPRLLSLFGAATVVYDCMDELANFRFAPPDISARERFLLEHADVVFTGGYRLFESKSRYHSNTHFFGCGVDVDHYSRARRADTEPPPEVAALPKPVYGYFGVIDERIDYQLLVRMAEAFANGSIVMVGPFAKVDPNSVPLRPNIHWLGQRSYQELPALVKGFDVCLMPFALNEATQYINPTKTLEYMAAGKPIVSTAVPDVVRQFTPVVAVAQSVEEFISLAHQAAERRDVCLVQRGIAWAQESSWENTVAAMRRLMLEAHHRRFAESFSSEPSVGASRAAATAIGAAP